MTLIFESKSFLVEVPEEPLVDRNDGGHITITPKRRVGRLQELDHSQAVELMRLMMVVGEAMAFVMNSHGIDIGRINYQDNGNWGVFKPEGPYQHVHLYGRAKGAKVQRYGQTLYFPHKDEKPEFYKENEPLHSKDADEISRMIMTLLASDKYCDITWKVQ